MGRTITKEIDDGFVTFEFLNKDKEVFSSFRINPTDVHMIERCESVSKEFAEMQNNFDGSEDVRAVSKYDAKLFDMFNFLLGYEASDGIFVKPMTPTTILPDGRIFSVLVMETIVDILEPEIKKRQRKVEKDMDKYLSKYNDKL